MPLPVDLANLTEEQLRGETCVRCGRVPLDAIKIHRQDGIELATCADRHARVCTDRPFWLTRPCPSWCDGHHHDRDGGNDRTHMSAWRGAVPLVLEDGSAMGRGLPYQPEYASLYLLQGMYERKPRIWCGKGESNQGWHMTAAEARELAATTTAAADLADQAYEGAPSAVLTKLAA